MVQGRSSRIRWYRRSKLLARPSHRRSFENPLELLRAEGDCLKSIFSRLQSPHLIWLCWYSCPYSCPLPWIPTENLRVLQVEGSRLKTLWREYNFQAPLQLRELVINAHILKFPKSIGKLKHLEKIVMEFQNMSIDLETLPDEFCHLQALKHLELNKCSKMKSLPDSFGNLRNLQHIDLYGCSSLQMLPDSFANLIQLKYLSLRSCERLTISNSTLGKISKLEFIDLSGCKESEVMPPQVAHQLSLKEMHLFGTNIKELPSAIGNLCNLGVLKLGTPFLELLPDSIGYLRSLENFQLQNCQKLICLPDSIRLLTQLRDLKNMESHVQHLPPCVMEMNNLEWLEVTKCPLRELPFKKAEGESETLTGSKGQRESYKIDASIEKGMFGLKHLELFQTRILEVSFHEGVCPNLQHLSMNFCHDLLEVGALPTALIKLELINCSALTKIEGFCGLAKLKDLNISGCSQVDDLPGLETLISLEELRASQCLKLKSIEGLAQLTKLQVLKVAYCDELKELPGIERLTSLRKLNAKFCWKLQWGGGIVEQLCQRLKEDLNI